MDSCHPDHFSTLVHQLEAADRDRFVDGRASSTISTDKDKFQVHLQPNSYANLFQSFSQSSESHVQLFPEMSVNNSLNNRFYQHHGLQRRFHNQQTDWNQQFNSIEESLKYSELSKELEKLDQEWELFEKVWNSKTSQDTQNLTTYTFETENEYLNSHYSVDELVKLGISLCENENLTRATLAFEAAIQREASEQKSILGIENIWVLLAETQAENEKELAAILAYQECLLTNSNHLTALLGLAISYTNESQEMKVLEYLERWLLVQYPMLNLTSAESVFERRDILSHLFLKAIYINSVDPDLQIALGLLFYNAGDYEKSIDCFSVALKLRPDDYQLWNRFGATLANHHRSEEAIYHYEKALSIKPNFIRAKHNLGVSYMNIGRYSEAVQHLTKALMEQQQLQTQTPKNISKNLWETLRRNFIYLERDDMVTACDERNLAAIKRFS